MMLRLQLYFFLFMIFMLPQKYAAQTVHDIAGKVRSDIRQAENDSVRIRKINLNIKEITIRNKDTALAFLQLEERITEQACAANEKQCRFLQSECEYGKGLYFHYHDQYLLAVEHYLKSAAIKQEIRDVRGLAQLYNMIGIVYRLVGDQQHALDFQNKSLAIFDSIADNKSASRAYNNIGNIYTDLHEFDKAVSMHQKSFELKKSQKDTTGMANSLNNISDCMREMGQYEKALEYDEEALQLRLPTGDSIGIAFSLQSKGLSLTKLNRLQEAIDNFDHAIAILINQGEHHALSENYTYAGRVLMKMNDCRRATEYFNLALEAAIKTNAIDKRKDALLGLSDASQCLGNTNLAFDYYKQYVAARDSIQNAEKSKQNARAEFQLQFDDMKRKMDAEKASLQKEAEKRQLIIYLFAAGAFITFSFLIFAVRSNRIKNKLNDELQQQKLTIEDKNKSIVDSITYAQRIQRALLASDKLLRKNLNDFFILYQPKDIVSGDFYWATEKDGLFYLVIADCTGHGVPGAFMSLLNISFLNEVILDKKISDPAQILHEVREQLIATLNPEGSAEVSYDGMDAVIMIFDKQNRILKFSGANNPLWIMREGIIHEYKADKMPVGFHYGEKQSFTSHEIRLQKGDCIYAFTDGFCDQFGGPQGKKYKMKNLKHLLLRIAELDPAQQKNVLTAEFDKWKMNNEQVDDVLFAGIHIS